MGTVEGKIPVLKNTEKNLSVFYRIAGIVEFVLPDSDIFISELPIHDANTLSETLRRPLASVQINTRERIGKLSFGLTWWP